MLVVVERRVAEVLVAGLLLPVLELEVGESFVETFVEWGEADTRD